MFRIRRKTIADKDASRLLSYYLPSLSLSFIMFKEIFKGQPIKLYTRETIIAHTIVLYVLYTCYCFCLILLIIKFLIHVANANKRRCQVQRGTRLALIVSHELWSDPGAVTGPFLASDASSLSVRNCCYCNRMPLLYLIFIYLI